MYRKIYMVVISTLLISWVNTTNIIVQAQTDKAPSVQKTAEDYRIQASKDYDSKNFKSALANYTKAIQLDPNDYRSYFERGLCRLNFNDTANAIKDYSEAIRIKPSYAIAYWRRGEDRLDNKGRINDFTTAIKLDPKLPHAYLSRGELFRKLGQKKAAIQDLNKAADLFKNLNDQKGYQLSIDALKLTNR